MLFPNGMDAHLRMQTEHLPSLHPLIQQGEGHAPVISLSDNTGLILDGEYLFLSSHCSVENISFNLQ